MKLSSSRKEKKSILINAVQGLREQACLEKKALVFNGWYTNNYV